MRHTLRFALVIGFAAVMIGEATVPAYAGGGVRAHGRSNVSSHRGPPPNRPNNGGHNTINNNKNVNINTNRNVNVDVDVDHHGGGYYGGCCYHDDYHPIATTAAVVATATVTAAVVGSIVSSVPSGCQTVIVGGLAYQQCGSTWYQPQISGSTTTYMVVNAPR